MTGENLNKKILHMLDSAGIKNANLLSVQLLAESKNRVFKIGTSAGPFIVKQLESSLAAQNELRNAALLKSLSGIRVPGVFCATENLVLMEFLPEAREAENLYGELPGFLRLTRDLEAKTRVPDDARDSQEYLENLRGRRGRLSPDHQEKIKKFLPALEGPENFFGPVPARFILSDFAPGNGLTSKGRFYFTDLEHAGMGDPRRFLCNLLLHPRSRITGPDFTACREELGLTESQVERIFPFSYLEWVMILLRHENPGAFSRISFFEEERPGPLYRAWSSGRFGLR